MKKKNIETKSNLIIYDLKGVPYFIKNDKDFEEADIDTSFLNNYDKIGFLNIKDTQIRIYFGVDETPKIWNLNPFLSQIIGEQAYSEVIIFVDEGEFDKEVKKLSWDEFETIVAKYIQEIYEKVYPEDYQEVFERSPKYGFTGVSIKASFEDIKISGEEVDAFFEENCLNKFSKDNIFSECIDSYSRHACDLLYKNGSVYILDRVTSYIDCYFHGTYCKDKILNKSTIN